MNSIEDVSELNPLILPYLKRGVITNNFLKLENYKLYISEKSLFYEKTDNVLLIFRKIYDVYRTYFYINSFESIAIPDNAVVEIVNPDIKTIEFFEGLGLRIIATRNEMLLKEIIGHKGKLLVHPTKNELSDVRDIICSNFNSKYGCIPSIEELDVNNILVSRGEDGSIDGIIRFNTEKNVSRVMHLAVVDKKRRSGIGSNLILGYMNHEKDKCREFRLWVNSDNNSAIEFYIKNGYDVLDNKSIIFGK